MPRNFSPLRYPGGKSRLSNYVSDIIIENNCRSIYAEPFAGGAGVALDLILNDKVDEAYINDLDFTVFAFWKVLFNDTNWLCDKVLEIDVTVSEWYKQRAIFNDYKAYSIQEVAFSFLFLNRTNRSGILNGGIIGGKNQTGLWKIDARFNRKAIVDKILKIAPKKKQFHVSNLDARKLIETKLSKFSNNCFVYIDPPYYNKGSKLYYNSYNNDDHALLASCITEYLKCNWIVSYDDVKEIREIYKNYKQGYYGLNYSAAARYKGSEVIVYSNGLKVPDSTNPFSHISNRDLESKIAIAV